MLLLSFIIFSSCQADAQSTEIAAYKKTKKVKYSYQHTSYTAHQGYNIPSMRVPAQKIEELKSPATALLIELQGLLEDAKSAFWSNKPIKKVERMEYCINQLEALDPYWELMFLKLEYDYYLDYEKDRYHREVVLSAREDSLRQAKEQQKKDSLMQLYIVESKKADSLSKAKERERILKKDSFDYVNRVSGYHFVNHHTLGLFTEPSPNSKLIVNMRVCTYVKVLSQPDILGYVYVEVSDYKGYTLAKHLVNSLDKVSVPKADIKFAKENHYVSIYIPAGSTYDPLRPHLGTGAPITAYPGQAPATPTPTIQLASTYVPPTSANTKDIAMVSEKNKRLPAPPKTEGLVINPNAATVTKTTQQPTKPGMHQCTAKKSDGSPCTNFTTSHKKLCYLHD